MEPYFFHGFRDFNIETLKKVLTTGFILPRKMVVNPKTDCNNIFNGNAWISLSQKSLIAPYMLDRFNESYSSWIPEHLCVVIRPDIEGVVYTDYIEKDEFYGDLRKKIVYDENPRRFSYYIDEVQTNIPIPVEDFLAIGYPLNHFNYLKSKEEVNEDIKQIYSMLDLLGLDIPIIDSTPYDFADNEQRINQTKIKKMIK